MTKNIFQKYREKEVQEDCPRSSSLCSHVAVNGSAEIFEGKKVFEIKMKLPGIDLDRLLIVVGKRHVFIRGSQQRHTGHRKHCAQCRNTGYKSFARTFRIPKHAANANVIAHYEDEMLRIIIPKKVLA